MPLRLITRIRPVLETDEDTTSIIRTITPKTQTDPEEPPAVPTTLTVPSLKNDRVVQFDMDAVYGEHVTQEDLFNYEAHNASKLLLSGKDITYLAYGSTNTGKTHTLRGGYTLPTRGLIPRLMSSIYRRAKKTARDNTSNIQIYLSYFEIYRDEIYDLFEPPPERAGKGLTIHDSGKMCKILGLAEIECADLKEFSKVYIEANRIRATAATKLNKSSSRSHAILKVKIVQQTSGPDIDLAKTTHATFVDLAGSEDARRSGTSSEALAEAASINKSLFALSQCIDAMAQSDKRIPTRDNKLTRVLNLGAKPKTMTTMIVTVAQGRDYHAETWRALNFVSRVRRLEVREIENECVFKEAPRVRFSHGLGGADSKKGFRPLADKLTPEDGEPPVTTAPVKMFTVFSDGGKTPTAPRNPGVLSNKTNRTPMVLPFNRLSSSPSKKKQFIANSPSKKARRPLASRSVLTPLRDAEDTEDFTKGIRYLAVMCERRALGSPAKRSPVKRGGLRGNGNGAASPINGLSGLMNVLSISGLPCPSRRAVVAPGGSPMKTHVYASPTARRLPLKPRVRPALLFNSPGKRRLVVHRDGNVSVNANANVGGSRSGNLGVALGDIVMGSPCKGRGLSVTPGRKKRVGGGGFVGGDLSGALKGLRQPVFGVPRAKALRV